MGPLHGSGKFHKIEYLALLFLVAGHLIGAWTSFGYHHPDEHYQILEWANYFLGINPDASVLPWEFGAKIRPWFQPLLHAGLMKSMLALGVYNPFHAVTVSQFIYSMLNVWVMVRIWMLLRERYSISPQGALAVSLLWFLPYIHARTSSENLSGILLSWALLGMLENRNLMRVGLFFGFAFLARYQTALGLAGLGFALLVRDRGLKKTHLALFTGFLIPVGIGVLLDRIGYGEWVFSPYRYFKVNLVDGVAARYNPYPWWKYFEWILQLNPLISVPLFLGCILFHRRARGSDSWILSPFVWVFFLLHCFMTNKEYRFLFPLLNWVPFMALVGLQGGLDHLRRPGWLALYGGINVLSFAVSTLHGASMRSLGAKFLAHRNLDSTVPVFASRDYRDPPVYYSLPSHELIVFTDSVNLETLLDSKRPAQVLIDGGVSDPSLPKIEAMLEGRSCQHRGSVIPRRLMGWLTRVPAARSFPWISWYDCP